MSKLLFFFGSYMVGKRIIPSIHTWRKVMISEQNGNGLGLGASFVITNGLSDLRHLFLTNCSYFSANSGRFPRWLRNWNHRAFLFRHISSFAQRPVSFSFATSFSRTAISRPNYRGAFPLSVLIVGDCDSCLYNHRVKILRRPTAFEHRECSPGRRATCVVNSFQGPCRFFRSLTLVLATVLRRCWWRRRNRLNRWCLFL